MADEVHYESADGLKLFARRHGRRDSPSKVLCMHGLTRNHKDFEPLIATLGEDHDIIAVDQRGRGRSEWDPQPERYAVPTYVGDMMRLLDLLGLREVALVGTSMGGLMSMIMMHRAPERFTGVVLNDIGPVLEKAGLDRIAGYVGGSAAVASWEEAARLTEQVQKSAFPHFGPEDWMAFAKRTWIEKAPGEITLDYDPAIAASLGAIRIGFKERFAAWRLFSKMKPKPLLVVRGENSDLFSAKTAARMVKRHPDAREIVVPGVGHAPILDEPEAAHGIKAFLERLRG